MKAIQITEFGGPEVMKYVELPDPVASGDDVVMDVFYPLIAKLRVAQA